MKVLLDCWQRISYPLSDDTSTFYSDVFCSVKLCCNEVTHSSWIIGLWQTTCTNLYRRQTRVIYKLYWIVFHLDYIYLYPIPHPIILISRLTNLANTILLYES